MAGAGGVGSAELRRQNLVGPAADFPRPLVGHREHLLPLLELGGERFQNFGLEAVERLDALSNARVYGRSGEAQYGIDVYGILPDGRYAVYQMRCVNARLTPAKLRRAVKDYFDGQRPLDATSFQLCWAADATGSKIDDELESLRRQYPGRHISIRDQAAFSRELIEYRDFVVRWFGEAVTESVYGAYAQPTSRAAAINADALLRGPLRALYLERDLDEAMALTATDPAAAAARFESIVLRLHEAGFVVHAAEIQSQRLEALRDAGALEQAFREGLSGLEAHVDDGWDPHAFRDFRLVLDLRAALTGGAVPAPLPSQTTISAVDDPWLPVHPLIQRSFAVLRYDALRVEAEQSFDGLVDATAAFIEGTSPDAEGIVPALRRLAEAALVFGHEEAMRRAHELAAPLLPQLPASTNAGEESDRIRLRLALADGSGAYDDLFLGASHGGVPIRLAGAVHARRARLLTWQARPTEAIVAWLEAIRAATTAGMLEDAADYLWAARVVRTSYGGSLDLGAFDLARRARELPTRGRALFEGSKNELNALRRQRELERPAARYRPSDSSVRRTLYQYLLETIVRGDLAGELAAHELLADLHGHLDEPTAALGRAIRAGDTAAAVTAARLLGAPAAHCLDGPPKAPWECIAALTAYEIVGDLVTLGQTVTNLPWILGRLVHPPDGWTDNQIRERAMASLAAVAYQIPDSALTGVVDTLRPYLAKDSNIRQPTIYSAIRTIARLVRVVPARAVTLRPILVGIIQDVPDLASELEEMGPALRELRADLENIANDQSAPGLHAAAELLAALHVPHPAVTELARRLAKDVHSTPTNERRYEFEGTSHQEAGDYGGYLPHGERVALAAKLAEIAQDRDTIEPERADAAYALRKLAPALDESERVGLFARIWPLINGPEPDDHTLSIGAGSLGPAALTAAAHLATTASQTSLIEQAALAWLADENTVTSAAVAIMALKGPTNISPATLASSRHIAARHAAAVLWTRNPTDTDLGRRLASAPETQVRAPIARGLIDLRRRNPSLADELSEQLRVDISATIRLLTKETRSQ